MNINDKIKELRKLMAEKGLDMYIEPSADPHQSEYLADHFMTRAFITGFTGSAGTALITDKEAILWTDGRYFIQAENQIRDNEFKLYRMNTPGYPSLHEWLEENVSEGSTIGLNGNIFSQGAVEKIEEKLQEKNISIHDKDDLIGRIWNDRPELSLKEAFRLKEEYSGKSTYEKLQDVRKEMEKKKATHFVLGSLDDIAWLYNIRGWDVENNPVVISYALISMEYAILFVDERKISESVKNDLFDTGVVLADYESISKHLEDLSKDSTVILQKDRINRSLYNSIPKECRIIDSENMTTKMKGIKNTTEIENQKEAYIKDCVALTSFFHWLENEMEIRDITEVSAAEKLLKFRMEQQGFIQPSFRTIAAYGPNAAMMHYSPSKSSCARLEKRGLFLVDSGGQYYDGTTDITRTVALGELNEQEKRDFTLVLKGQINLLSARFLQGTSGHVLDILARQPLWNEGIDYKSGTGHGVGYLLNVHEGPHRIATAPNNVAMEPGMIVTIEPGVYREGMHGIRTENVVVVKDDIENEWGKFLNFELLSYCYIDRDCIIPEMLSEQEKIWLDQYHSNVFEKLKDRLSDEVRDWLKAKTKPISTN
ncbi:aminopeptidase P family protein [Gudongella sp. DL1XJH-153]|uniref:aminopeptidase P family protein n=1 Tax=Gudongella sp. DL1XJH-153 TaxID=3409804 RepID=UPI003BB4BB53